MNPSLFKRLGWVCVLSVSLRVLVAAPASVYLVLGSDTAVWNDVTTVDVYSPHPHYSADLYANRDGPAAKVMEAGFRDRYRDSYGQPLKFTWWLMVGNIFRYADNTDVPMANTMNLYWMKKYHGQQIQQFGDELSLHYHTFLWSDYAGAGTYYWNQARSFAACRDDFNWTLGQCLLEEEVFPVSFRSGWHYMDNEWQQYLDQLLPYSMHNNWPAFKAWSTNQPINNVQDWSKAPSAFVPYHPSPTNYQVPGEGIGWNLRSIKMQNLQQLTMDEVFIAAARGTDQVVCIWNHLPENFLGAVTNTVACIESSAAIFPAIHFRYCTAVEAMQRWQGHSEQTPPRIELSTTDQDQTVSLAIHCNKPIFQPQPFVALKDVFQQYQVVSCVADGVNSWYAVLPTPRNRISKVAVAVTDQAGNLATRILRYLPDDCYIDNQDNLYAENSGRWRTITNAAWGGDARIALLAPDDVARVTWSLPVSWPGRYDVFAQVPAVSNSAGNLWFRIYSSGSNLWSVLHPSPLPPDQWVHLGDCRLDAQGANSLEMTVSGANQPNSFAVADVIKLVPNVLDEPGCINDVRIDPGDTTVNITWTTLAPTATWLEYGRDFRYGSFSATNSRPATNHVVTLSGLTPGTSYYFQIDASAETSLSNYTGFFTTINFASIESTALLFDLNWEWKFAARNMDGIQWQAAAYDDSAWPSGPGLLWVDTRTNGPNPEVHPRNTPMPRSPFTGFPFITYYFRTHFLLNGSSSITSLTFSNYVDDGAVFYLNGVEIHRMNMAQFPAAISNATLASNYSCGGDATCPVVFRVAGAPLTNLVAGDNVLAVEVHNYSPRSTDITFGSALSWHGPSVPPPRLKTLRSGDDIILYWNGGGFFLQQTSQLGLPESSWMDVPGPVSTSPYTAPHTAATFYRLRTMSR